MNPADFQTENSDLRQRLEEAEATLAAIQNGEVDALVVGGDQIYTLEGADRPYRVLVEAMPQGAATLSTSGAIVYCNQSFAQMTKRPLEKIIGMPVEGFFSAADQQLVTQHLSGISAAFQAELTLAAEDGDHLPVLVSFSPLSLNDVSVVCLMITDLTEHKQNQQLQATDRLKNEFLAMLAHELRNPIAPIANAAHALCLRNKGGDDDIQRTCGVIARQVRQLSRIVDDLLDISRITEGKIKLQKTTLTVSSIISAAVETSRPVIDARKHQFRVSMEADGLHVEADITRMAQVITNLLNNAAKYTEPGGEISLHVGREGNDATITIRDNGIGMTTELLPTVFDLFTQADRTIDRAQGGLGIGLTLVHRLVEMHGGSVVASSDGLGRGSEFVVRLPLVATPHRQADESRQHKTNGRSAAFQQRVLVVDDNVDSAASLAMILETMGHETVVSHDGPTAIEMAKSFRPTLVLLDIGLPGMNGYMVAENLRSISAFRDVVLVALTGYGDDRDRKHSTAAGFDHHFVKPLNFVVLEELLASLPKMNSEPNAGIAPLNAS